MKDQQEGEPQSGTDESKHKPMGTIHYLDEWRGRNRRNDATRSEARRGHRPTGPTGGGKRAGPGRSYGSYGSGYARGFGRGGTPSGYGPDGRPTYQYSGRVRQPTRATRAASRSRPVSRLHGRGNSLGRTGASVTRYIVWLTVLGVIALVVLMLRAVPAGEFGPMVDPPTTLRIWIAETRDDQHELANLFDRFSTSHEVDVQWQTTTDPYDFIHTVLVGPAPDVIFVDGDTGARLLAVDALLELFETTGTAADTNHNGSARNSADPTGPPQRDNYLLQLAEETMWVRSLRAAIPRRADNPEVARTFIAYLADEVGTEKIRYQ